MDNKGGQAGVRMLDRVRAVLERVSGGASLILIVVLWQLLVSTHLLHNPAIPSPGAVVASLYHGILTGHHQLLFATIETLERLVLGYAVAIVSGAFLGMIAGRHDDFASALNPIVALWIPLPAIVTIPVISLWLGAGDVVIVLTVIFSAWIPIYLGAQQGARSISKHQLWVAQASGASHWTTFRKVIIPGALVHMIPSLRIGLGYAWRAVIAAEIVVQQGKGLGITIFSARQFFDVPTMYAGVVLIAILGLTLERVAFPLMEGVTIQRWGLVR